MSRTKIRCVILNGLILTVAVTVPEVHTMAQPAPVQTEVAFPSGDLQLRGFIWKPEGGGPFPALLWNHGSEKLPGWLPGLAPSFVRQGYIFFIPHRRGQGRSPGPYIVDQLNLAGSPAERSRRLVQLHEAQLSDQLAALTYLKSLPSVDASRLAVAGCSFGGIQTMLAAERTTGYRAAINFAGAAQTWQGSPDIQRRLVAAARASMIPILFVQAENDYDLSPTRILSAEMQRAGKPFQAKIYPPFGSTRQDGHEFCVKGVEAWGPDVFPYLAAHLR